MIFIPRNAVRILFTPGSLLVVLLLLIVNQLALLSWRVWLPAELPRTSLSAVVETEDGGRHEDVPAPPLTLFGTATDKAPSPAAASGEKALHEAPRSSLDVQVTGILASPVESRSIAIIAQGGRQSSLGVGDALPGHDASIAAIFADRVVITYRGSHEALPLLGRGTRPAAAQPQPRSPARTGRSSAQPAQPARPDEGQSLARLRTTLQQQAKAQPQTLLAYLNIAPVMEDNTLTGYRLNPGQQGELFQRAGLQPNDLAVSLNGLDLRDTQQAQRALQQLPELDAVNLTVEREGQLHDIHFSLGDD